ncbi:MAG: M48 family metalloprotease [Pseudomonadota bacterium]
MPIDLNAQQSQFAWRVAELAAASAEEVVLGSPRGAGLHTVSTRQMRLLNTVKQRIDEVAETTSDFVIVDGSQPNAFAGRDANGTELVAINFGMLEILDEDVHLAAGLIGHEVAHLKLGHADRDRSDPVRSTLLKQLGGVALGALGVPAGGYISDMAVTAYETEFSRDDERAADYLGAVWSVEAGFDPSGAWRLHDYLNKRGGGAGLAFLSTHPSGAERISTLKSLAERLGKPQN